MFGSKKGRKRAPSNPTLNASNANSSALTAASQAFMAKGATPALSSAAAATALRSRPTTPTSVADVQTKRTVRRAGSVSSIGSSNNGSVRGPASQTLERRGSSGSMSERTFRDPSPLGYAQPVPSAPDAPPVPAIPKHVSTGVHRRASSLEVQATRIASPPPNINTGRGSSLGPGGPASPVSRRGHRINGLATVQERTSLERPSSRGTSAAQNTSSQLVYDPNSRTFVPAPQRHDSHLYSIEQRIQEAAHQPVKKKKKAALKQGEGTHFADGSSNGRPKGTAVDAIGARVAAQAQLQAQAQAQAKAQADAQSKANATTRAAQAATAQSPASPPRVTSPPLQAVSQPARLKSPPPAQVTQQIKTAPKKKKTKVAMFSDSESDQASYAPNSSADESDTYMEPKKSRAPASQGPVLNKKPSVVREEPEREEQEAANTPPRATVPPILQKIDTDVAASSSPTTSPLPKSNAGQRAHALAEAAYAKHLEETKTAAAASQPAAPSRVASPPRAKNISPPGGSDRGSSSRVHSESPVRQAHFAAHPDSLAVIHQPPARSISPRKSAMKHSNSPRGTSPAGELQAHSSNLSEVSNGSTIGSDDMVARKKANRVSFDESSNIVLGEAAPISATDSPLIQSPQTKRGWSMFGKNRNKRREANATFSEEEEEDDEVMRPRPALPSFGSVRERKSSKEPEERTLVNPREPIKSTESALAPATASNGDANVAHQEFSNDHVAGALFSQDAASRNAANIAKPREPLLPLPPEVTSVEGSGYVSDSTSTYSMDEPEPEPVLTPVPETKTEPVEAVSEAEKAIPEEIIERQESAPPEIITPRVDNLRIDNVPAIAVVQPTPTVEQTEEKQEWLEMPGGFPESTSESGTATPVATEPQNPAKIEFPATVGIAEPSPVVSQSIPSYELPSQSTFKTEDVILEESDTDGNSIYSDAAEDLSDLEGDGFQSLDAVVDSPVVTKPLSAFGRAQPGEAPVSKSQNGKSQPVRAETAEPNEPEIDGNWTKAQAYWNSLSADKKRQLELEALQMEQKHVEESDSGSDTEVPVAPAPQPKPKKKKVQLVSARQESESDREIPTLPVIKSKKKARDAQEPVQPPARQLTPKNDRTYMIAPGTKAEANGSSLRSSMRTNSVRSQPEPESNARTSLRGPGSLRSSMRGPAPAEPKETGGMRSSMRGAPPATQERGALQKKTRPISLPPQGSDVALNRQVLSLSTNAAASSSRPAKPAAAPALRRRGSADSDSSFVRSRPQGEGSRFRQSMRASSDLGRSTSPIQSSRFSIRSASPAEPVSRMNANSMRGSMRSNSVDAPTMRGSNSKRGSRLSGFGRSSKPAPAQKSRPQRRSRFADSSDEEDERPTFRSRFMDSSDSDDDPAPARPMSMGGRSMRSAPISRASTRNNDDGDSSDLPDSDNEIGLQVAKARQNGTVASQGGGAAPGTLRRSGSGRETISIAATNGGVSTRPDIKPRRGSFMSILRRKKPDPSSKVHKLESESAARRDTPLERSRSDLQAVRTDSYTSAGEWDSPQPPKLQKRNTSGSRASSGQWPLTDVTPGPLGKSVRPSTADASNLKGGLGSFTFGANPKGASGRPELGARRSTATGIGSVDYGATNGVGVADGGFEHRMAAGNRKKKKFPGLRKMFGLDD